VVVLGASGKLTTQIESGAPFDAFLSADMKYPRQLYADSFAVDSPKIYSRGTLVLWTLRDASLKKGPGALLDGGFNKIAVANPSLAPYGEQSLNCMKYFGLYDSLSAKLVFGESISQVNTFLLSGAADAAFTAKSIVTAPENKDKGHWIELDPKSYTPIDQGAVILRYGNQHHGKAVREFYRYLFSKRAKKILKKYGYLTD
ncbi:MAG TPA: molybdate ABC transporter substrate-binding protein, partial [Candidatus Edwardsbacteria bacterium]|nr:molybdate ABC transporter substrate-binding protein [Candidatus Edwardsbacteria bacterium]